MRSLRTGKEPGQRQLPKESLRPTSFSSVSFALSNLPRVPIKQKSPTRRPGACGFALSREGRGPLRHGRVAWLSAARADHSGGTAADSHGLPRSLACKLKIQCKPRLKECQCERWPGGDTVCTCAAG